MNLGKMTTTVLVVVLTAGLAACGDDEVKPETVTITATVTTSPQEQESTKRSEDSLEDLFIEVVRDKYPELAGNEENELSLAKSTCGALKNGATMQEMFEIVAKEAGGDVESAKYIWYIMGAGIGAFCPEYIDELTDFSGGNKI